MYILVGFFDYFYKRVMGLIETYKEEDNIDNCPIRWQNHLLYVSMLKNSAN